MTKLRTGRFLGMGATAAALWLMATPAAHAGERAPWHDPLQKLVDWLTGETMLLFIIIAAGVALIGMMFSERGGMARRVFGIVLAGAILVGLGSAVTTLFGATGALLGN